MKTCITFCIILFTFQLFAQSNAETVLFDSDSYQISAEEKKELARLYKENLGELGTIQLKGHTDSNGSLDYNDRLAKNRVTAVRNELIRLGCDATRIQVEAYGERQPISSNDSDRGKQENRRVEITWTSAPEPVTEKVINVLPEAESITHCIQSDKDTVLVLPQGTVIRIDANTFSSEECVQIEFKEAYNYGDMIMNRLTTRSGDQMLETGGMIYIMPTNQQGDVLRPQKEITIFLPADEEKEGMGLFYGEVDPHDSLFTWNAEENDFLNSMRYLDYDLTDDSGQPDDPECDRCKILFCRLFGRADDAVKGMFNKDVRAENQEFRECQRKFRKEKKSDENYEALLKQYQVDNLGELQDTLRKLNEIAKEEYFEEAEAAITQGKADTRQFRSYVTRTTNIGWINCDRFTGNRRLISMRMPFDDKGVKDIQAFVLFKNVRGIMPSRRNEDRLYFPNIPLGEQATVFVIKNGGDGLTAATFEVTTQEVISASPFISVDEDELKEMLENLNGYGLN